MFGEGSYSSYHSRLLGLKPSSVAILCKIPTCDTHLNVTPEFPWV